MAAMVVPPMMLLAVQSGCCDTSSILCATDCIAVACAKVHSKVRAHQAVVGCDQFGVVAVQMTHCSELAGAVRTGTFMGRGRER